MSSACGYVRTLLGSVALSLLLHLLYLQPIVLAQSPVPACTKVQVCQPSLGDTWTQDSLATVIWNPDMTSPLDKGDSVDLYIVDDSNSTRAFLLQRGVELNTGVAAMRLDSIYFPADAPVNRSCHILITGTYNSLDGTHSTFNSSSFFLIRTKQMVSGTTVSIAPTTSSSSSFGPPAFSPSIIPSPQETSSTTTTSGADARSPGASDQPIGPSSLPGIGTKAGSNVSNGALSPLVIGLISAGTAALFIALVAIGLLLRTRRRYKGNSAHFRSLDDLAPSPTDDMSKGSLFKGEGGNPGMNGSGMATGIGSDYGRDDGFNAPESFSAIAGRSSITTTRSAEPMIKGASSMLAYQSTSPPSPTAPMPLLERKPSVPQSLTHPSSDAISISMASPAKRDGSAPQSPSHPDRYPRLEPVLSANDAQLIAETFRKSMRKPRWYEDRDLEEDDDEADGERHVRRAADELMKKELSEEGVDVQRGVQRRVTIQDRPQRSELGKPPTLSSSSLSLASTPQTNPLTVTTTAMEPSVSFTLQPPTPGIAPSELS